MPNRSFSASNLYHPRFDVSIGLAEGDKKEYLKWIEKSCNTLQAFEIYDSNYCAPNPIVFSSITNEYKQYLVLEDVRPELFIRRDFISRFALHGFISIKAPDDCLIQSGYSILCQDTRVIITLNQETYQRLGLEHTSRYKINEQSYFQVHIDLCSKDLLENNKIHDTLVQKLKRLKHSKFLYFKFHTSTYKPELDAANKFFNHVIKEYEVDGFKPVPLAKCITKDNEVDVHINSALKKKPDLQFFKNLDFSDNNHSELALIRLLDWFGFQTLNIDCNQDELKSVYYSLDEEHEASKDICLFNYFRVKGYYNTIEIKDFIEQFFHSETITEGSSKILTRAIVLNENSMCPKSEESYTRESFKSFIFLLQNSEDKSKKKIFKIKSSSRI